MATNDAIRSQIEPVVAQLISLTEHAQAATREVLAWPAAQFGVTTPGQTLEAFADLDEETFIQQVRARRPEVKVIEESTKYRYGEV